MLSKTRNSATHRIEVRVHDLAQLFNLMDPSPFYEKELDADAEEFIVGWAQELPTDDPVTLLVHLDRTPADGNAHAMISDAIHHHFNYKAEATRRRLSQLTREGSQDLIRGVLFLAVCLFVAHELVTIDSPFMSIFRESILIGGWVAMWRPIEVFLYERWPLKSLIELYIKLSRMPVDVRLPEVAAR